MACTSGEDFAATVGPIVVGGAGGPNNVIIEPAQPYAADTSFNLTVNGTSLFPGDRIRLVGGSTLCGTGAAASHSTELRGSLADAPNSPCDDAVGDTTMTSATMSTPVSVAALTLTSTTMTKTTTTVAVVAVPGCY